MATKQDRCIAASRELIDIASQFRGLREAAARWLAKDASENYAGTWGNLPTVVLNADGTVAGANDGSPNLANPINVPAGAPLLVSRNQLNSMKLLLSDLQAFLGNAAVATSNRSPVIDDLVS